MTYCLMTEDGKIRVEISCLVKNRPTTVGQLVKRIEQGTVDLLKPQKLTDRLRDADPKTELDTDWTATGTGGRFINWIPIENL